MLGRSFPLPYKRKPHVKGATVLHPRVPLLYLWLWGTYMARPTRSAVRLARHLFATLQKIILVARYSSQTREVL